MNKKFINCDNVSGTSFWGGYVEASAEQINEVLGECLYAFDDKVTYEWDCKVDGIPFAVYDWKEYNPSIKTVLNYHIGTTSKAATAKVVKALKAAGLNAVMNNE